MVSRFVFYLFLLFLGYLFLTTPIWSFFSHWLTNVVIFGFLVAIFVYVSKKIGPPPFIEKLTKHFKDDETEQS